MLRSQRIPRSVQKVSAQKQKGPQMGAFGAKTKGPRKGASESFLTDKYSSHVRACRGRFPRIRGNLLPNHPVLPWRGLVHHYTTENGNSELRWQQVFRGVNESLQLFVFK